MKEFLQLITPYKTNSPKVRIGPPMDGGYVCPQDILDSCSALMTYGVGHEYRYEVDFFEKTGKTAYLFDHTMGPDHRLGHGPETGHELYFTHEGLGIGVESCKEWYEHADDLGIEKDILLKLDIEGTEYDYFKNTDHGKLRDRVICLFLEVHWLSDSWRWEHAAEMMRGLNENFFVNHLHSNNWSINFEYEELQVPNVLELTLINRNFTSNIELDTEQYPVVGIDYPNNPDGADLDMSFVQLLHTL